VVVAVHRFVVALGVDNVSACDVRYAAHGTRFSVKVRGLHHFHSLRFLHPRICEVNPHQEADIALASDVGMLAYFPKIVGKR
jgi:hypothetical protein